MLGRPLQTAAAWTVADALAHPEEWQLHLTAQDAADIVAAAKAAVSSGKPVPVRQAPPSGSFAS